MNIEMTLKAFDETKTKLDAAGSYKAETIQRIWRRRINEARLQPY